MNTTIAVMQTIGIVLVVAGHSFYKNGDHPLCLWIYSFHMPLFFFVSGFLIRYNNDRKGIAPQGISLADTARRRARRLLAPYLIISTLVFVPKALMSALAVRPTELTPQAYLHSMLWPYDNPIGSFWFLPTLFLITIAFTAYIRRYSNALPLLLLLTAVNPFITISKSLPLNPDGALFFMPYLVAGYLCCERGWQHAVERKAAVLAPVALLVSLTSLYVCLKTGYNPTNILAATSGIIMCMTAGQWYERRGCKFLNHLFGASYTIYIYSWFVQALCFQVIMRLADLPLLPTAIAATLLGIYVPLMVKRRFGGLAV